MARARTMRPAMNAPPRISRPVPMALFVAVLGAMLAIAVISLFLPDTPVEGMPPDPSAQAARDLLFGHLMPACGDLRFASVFLGEAPPGLRTGPPDSALMARAEALLDRAREAHPFEPRVVAALGHLRFARRQPDRAAVLYRRAIFLRAHCSEAHLGLGVVLGLASERESDPLQRRALALEALAQFTAVRPASALALDALYDRAVMLLRVGRRAEAREAAGRFLASEPTGVWAERLRAEIAETAAR
jgi:hypothetical protein